MTKNMAMKIFNSVALVLALGPLAAASSRADVLTDSAISSAFSMGYGNGGGGGGSGAKLSMKPVSCDALDRLFEDKLGLEVSHPDAEPPKTEGVMCLYGEQRAHELISFFAVSLTASILSLAVPVAIDISRKKLVNKDVSPKR